MPFSKQQPLTAPRGRSEHNFAQSSADWEAAVFDRAAYFATIEMRSEPRYKRLEWRHFPWAVRYARMTNTGACIYAITASGRFTQIDRDKWDEWEQRWWENRSIETPVAPAPQTLPTPQYYGPGWRRVSS